ncbi:hypothetical protein R3P38DRAFT_3193000 [Favolaschia claudopus]|uniref:Uncharacterized protein n=1 Tax=Favolaschia claudopus TaxID=2862362 RepID=A0AAW0BJG1_9AGAR
MHQESLPYSEVAGDTSSHCDQSAWGEDKSSFFLTPRTAPPQSTSIPENFKGHSHNYYITMTGGTGGTGGASGTGLGGDGGRGDGPRPVFKIHGGTFNYSVPKIKKEFESAQPCDLLADLPDFQR